jgi:FkbM family methyltransferase
MNTAAQTRGSLFVHPVVVRWRNRLRHNRLLRHLYSRWVARHDYEERFSDALLAAVRPGDVVWDVGANVGWYAERFLARDAVRVVCFEPAPEAVRTLQTRFAAAVTAGRAHIVPVALSDATGTVRFAADGAAPTNRIVAGAPEQSTIDVPVRAGDEALREYALPAPHIVKIDVEGYEWEVVAGLRNVLAGPALRGVFVEVHFSLLNERGCDDGPERIVKAFQSHGLRVRWLDPSHLAAVRD